MNARQRREFAEIVAAGGSIEFYPSVCRSALLRVLRVGRRRAAGSVVYLDDRRPR